MKSTIIRFATISDVPRLLPLMTQLGYPTKQEILEKRFDYFLTLNGYGIAVACQDDRILGWVAWSQSMPFVLDKVRIRVEGLVVDENYRGQGIGKKLMLFLEEHIKHLGPAVIELTSGIRRAKDGTHEFYKSLGYKNEGDMAKLYLRKEI